MFEKAFESYKKQLRYGLHKVHLLCLLSHGIQLSHHCNDPTLQCLVFSLLVNANDLLYNNPSHYTTDSLLKLLRWFSDEKSLIERAVHGDESTNLGINQILVSLLRALGLRTRLIMVLNPLSYKTTPTDRKKSVSNTGASVPKKIEVCSKHGKSPAGPSSVNSVARKRKRSLGMDDTKEDVIESKSDTSTGGRLPTGIKQECTGRTRSSVRNRTSMCSKPTTPEKMQSVSEGASSTTECGSSPYFKKKLGKSKPSRRKKSPSSKRELKESDDKDYIPLSENYGQTQQKTSSFSSDGESDEFVPPKPKKKRESLTKKPVAKKLKKAVDSSSTSTSHNTMSLSSTAAKPKDDLDVISEQTSSLVDVQLVSVEDTSCWAEVFLVCKKKWTCVHLPSCSVGQPQLCEKHCTLPLNYVVAFENGMLISSSSRLRLHTLFCM